MNPTNYTMLCDFYELTMGGGYLKTGMDKRISYFDMFYRSVPDGGGFAIVAGLEQVIDFIKNLRFTEHDIHFLRDKGGFSEDFLDYLKTFRFTGDMWAMPEGSIAFPNEPILTVRAPAIEAQFIETFILLTINHQSLVATKANRIVRAAEGRPITEFGSRRAQGADAALYGARATYIAGCSGTACTMAERDFGVPSGGTMAHSWVQMFDSEIEAFRAYCSVYPDNPTLLVDTYSVLSSGVPNAITVFKECGISHGAIRLDSGDIAYLSAKARALLDAAGLHDIKITASNSLDEHIIRDILRQGAAIDSFGVGERMITAKSDPVFGGVYKLVAVERDGEVVPKIKISENTAKITTPHFKRLYRLYDNDTKKAIADLLCVHDEKINDLEPLTIFDPDFTWKRKTLTGFTAREMCARIFKNGECVYTPPDIEEVRDHCRREVATLWDEVTRFENPHRYYVDLSQRLWDVKRALLDQNSAP